MPDKTITPEKEPLHNNAPERSFTQKIWDYAKSRFNKDNWFGSSLLPFMIKNGYDSHMSAITREENGKKSIDFERMLGADLFITEKTWSFFSTRGGTFPEGKNMFERGLNALKHPLASSTQFEWLLLIPSKILTMYSNCAKGFNAYGIGLKNGKTPYKEEKIRLINGVAQIGTFFFTGYGHFRDHSKETPADNAQEQKSSSFLAQKKNEVAKSASSKRDKGFWNNVTYFLRSIPDTIKKVWQKDPLIVVGAVISILIPPLLTIEGKIKEKVSPVEASYLKKNGIQQTLVNIAYSFYTFQRVAKGNYTTDNIADTGVNAQEFEQIEEQKGTLTQPSEKTFTSRFAQASVRNAGKAGMALAA